LALLAGALSGAVSFGCTNDLEFSSGSTGASDAGGAAGGLNGTGGRAIVEPGSEPDWELTFAEECEGPTLHPAVSTLMRVGDSSFRSWGQRADWMADEQVTVANGLCTITALDQPSGDRAYTSGVLNTPGTFEQEFGRFEARLKFPAGVGLWPQWWLRSIQGWPPAIDIASIHGHAPERLHSGVWFTGNAGRQDRSGSVELADLSSTFHVYSATWTESEIVIHVDGAPVQRIDFSGVPPLGPLYPIFNLSIHTGEVGLPPDDSTPFPASLHIDWIRVYRRVP
jgi:beta-glucanase (GH16 family)